MKLYSAFLIILASFSLAQAQHEVRCQLEEHLANANHTETVGSCGTNPQLWKRLTYERNNPFDAGILWWSICDICPAPGFPNPYTVTVPSVFSTGGCFAVDGFVLEECWPIFFAPDKYYEPLYCGDVFFQVTQSQTVGSFNPQTVSNCVKNPSLTQKFDCISDNTPITPTHHGRCPTTPSTEEECESVNWFWNPINDGCQEEGPPPCLLEPVICDPGSWSFEWCDCIPYSSPIVIDVANNGFNLTNASEGVVFNLNGIGGQEKLAWTSVDCDDAWLVLDRNGNGTVDDGTELFGDVTPQPDPPATEKKNGFRALAEYDRLANGGNASGQIDSGDSVFSSLRLWQDTNHDGLSQPSELHALPSKNVAAIELHYKLSKKTDNNGNRFSFRAKVKSSNGQQLGRWAWDVYLVKSQ